MAAPRSGGSSSHKGLLRGARIPCRRTGRLTASRHISSGLIGRRRCGGYSLLMPFWRLMKIENPGGLRSPTRANASHRRPGRIRAAGSPFSSRKTRKAAPTRRTPGQVMKGRAVSQAPCAMRCKVWFSVAFRICGIGNRPTDPQLGVGDQVRKTRPATAAVSCPALLAHFALLRIFD